MSQPVEIKGDVKYIEGIKIDVIRRYVGCMMLHAIGDTIGFKNGKWEFNYWLRNVDHKYANDLLYEFIWLGGINNIYLKDWIVSDDTVLHMGTAKALIEYEPPKNNLEDLFVKYYVESMDDMYKRYPGKTTIKNTKLLKEGTDWKDIPYNFMDGGSGGSMRSCCIGLAFYGEENRELLVKHSINAGRITHNSVIGYLGSFVSALFTAFAIENVDIEKWPFKLIKIFESDIIDNHLKNTFGFKDYEKDKDKFIDKWRRYNEDRFRFGKVMNNPSFRDVAVRIKHYHIFFSMKDGIFNPGAGGDDSVIIAYDCLLDARNGWEKLIVYSALHPGDSDTTACIACAWYGALYGLTNVPKNNYKYLEYRSELIEMGKQLYKKYYKK